MLFQEVLRKMQNIESIARKARYGFLSERDKIFPPMVVVEMYSNRKASGVEIQELRP